MFKTIKDKWDNLSTKKKRLFVFGIVIAIIVVLALALSVGRKPAVSEEQLEVRRKSQYELLNPDMSHEVLSEKLMKDVQRLTRDNRELKEDLDKLRETVNNIPAGGSLSGTLPGVPGASGAGGAPNAGQGSDIIGTSTAAEREFGLRSSLRGMGAFPVQKGNDVFPPIPVQPKVPSQGGLMEGVGAGTPPLGQPVINLPEKEGSQGVVINTPNNTPSVGVADARVMGSISFKSEETSKPSPYTGTSGNGQGGGKENAAARPKTSEFYNFYIPTSTHFKVRLLTGLDAPTGPKAQSQPHPLILRVQDLSFLPNEARQSIAGCHVLGEGIGDLSSERARIRGLTLSCVDSSDNNVIDEEISGYVADTDGKGSLRGRVVSKQGRFLAMSLQAAFVEGVAQGFSSSGTTTYVGAYGTAETQSDIESFGDGFKQGFASGASKSAQKLSEFYLKAAEDMYPIIEISANRDATFIVTKGKRFSANEKMYLPVVKNSEVEGNSTTDSLDL